MAGLVNSGLIRERDVIGHFFRRTRNAYPTYDLKFEANLGKLAYHLASWPNLSSAGGRGCSAYVNQDHAIEMGFCAAEEILTQKIGTMVSASAASRSTSASTPPTDLREHFDGEVTRVDSDRHPRPGTAGPHARTLERGRVREPAPAAYPDAGPQSVQPARRSSARSTCCWSTRPRPDGAIWIRSQHRVGRRSRENMIWPQVSLAQLAAMVHPELYGRDRRRHRRANDLAGVRGAAAGPPPRFYITQVTAPTLTNDMYGAFLAKSLGAWTMAFGTHVTPMVRETLEPFPALDFVLRGEPEYTFKELVQALAELSRERRRR